jgi:WAS/WASL-interacting protein
VAPAPLAGALAPARRKSSLGAPPAPPPRAPVPAATAALHASTGVPGSALASLLADLVPPPPPPPPAAAGAKRARSGSSSAPPPPLPLPAGAEGGAASRAAQLVTSYGLSDAIAALLSRPAGAAWEPPPPARGGEEAAGVAAAAAPPPSKFLIDAWAGAP